MGCLRGPVFLPAFALVMSACAHGNPACEQVQPGTYFPAGSFHPAQLDASLQRWYGAALCAMKEAPLAQLPVDETYRFLWLRSFHPAVSVRIQTADGKPTLVAVELNQVGGHGPTAIERQTERALSAQEWASLTALLGTPTFWSAPTDEDVEAADGAEWIFEGRRSAQYHVVSRFSPESGPFRAAGEAFLRAAHLSFPADEMY